MASGITQRAPPRAWAKILDALSTLGEAPLEKHPICIRRIPGQRRRYVAQHNYLTLHRQGDDWTPRWQFEHAGTSPGHPL